MGYINETTHYGIPLPLGSDLTTPMDYNTAAEAVDAAVFEAVSNSSGAVDTAAEAVQTANAAATTAAGAVTEAQTAHAVADAATTAAGTAQSLANSALSQINEIKPVVLASVTADGVKTITEIYNELYAAVPATVNKERLRFVTEAYDGSAIVRTICVGNPDTITFFDLLSDPTGANTKTEYHMLSASNSKRIDTLITTSGTSITVVTSTAPHVGNVFKIELN